MSLYIHRINYTTKIAELSDGQQLEITNWVDGDEEVEPQIAVVCVAGPDKDGQWYTAWLDDFQKAKNH